MTKNLSIEEPMLAETTRTQRQNAALRSMGEGGTYKSQIHEIQRHYTYRFRGSGSPAIDCLDDDVRSHGVESIRKELQALTIGQFGLLAVSFPKNFGLTPEQSINLVKMQIEADAEYVRVYFGEQWSIEACEDVLSAASDECDGQVLVPSLDMGASPEIFREVYSTVQREYDFVAFTYRSPGKLSKMNYWTIQLAEGDGVHKHISMLPWRRRDTAQSRTVPLAMWTVGFDSFAFGSRPMFVSAEEKDSDVEQVKPTWDVDSQYIKYYNPRSKMFDKLHFFKQDQKCGCPVHRKRAILATAEEFYETGQSAIFSSIHDMHEIQCELRKLGKRNVEKIKEDAQLVELFQWTVGKRRSNL